MPSVPELIAQSRNKQISGEALQRGLVSHREWQLPISEASVAETLAGNSPPPLQLFTTSDGATCLLIFSSGVTLNTYREARTPSSAQHHLQVPGTWLFQLPLDNVSLLWVDALTAYDVSYSKNSFDPLRDLAKAILVEEALTGLRQGIPPPEAIQTVRDYKNFYVPVMKRHDKPTLVMAPDTKGRTLAAAFTSNDTFDAFLPQARQIAEGSEVQQMQVSGTSLFNTFRGMQIDGMVFNCSGPVTPIAFAQRIAQIVLEGS